MHLFPTLFQSRLTYASLRVQLQSTWFLVIPRTFAKFYTVGSLFLIGR
jgi:hypothetical protein